jgi:hypothetical protein
VQVYPASAAFPNGSYHSGVERYHLGKLLKEGWIPMPGTFSAQHAIPNTFERHGSDYQMHPVQAMFYRPIGRRFGSEVGEADGEDR